MFSRKAISITADINQYGLFEISNIWGGKRVRASMRSAGSVSVNLNEQSNLEWNRLSRLHNQSQSSLHELTPATADTGSQPWLYTVEMYVAWHILDPTFRGSDVQGWQGTRREGWGWISFSSLNNSIHRQSILVKRRLGFREWEEDSKSRFGHV